VVLGRGARQRGSQPAPFQQPSIGRRAAHHHRYRGCAPPRPARTCHIAVGTPGRVCALLASGALVTRALRLLVLDEADQLMGEGFYPDVTWAHDQLPAKKQARRAAGHGACLQEPPLVPCGPERKASRPSRAPRAPASPPPLPPPSPRCWHSPRPSPTP
jgi:hypothetical protein